MGARKLGVSFVSGPGSHAPVNSSRCFFAKELCSRLHSKGLSAGKYIDNRILVVWVLDANECSGILDDLTPIDSRSVDASGDSICPRVTVDRYWQMDTLGNLLGHEVCVGKSDQYQIIAEHGRGKVCGEVNAEIIDLLGPNVPQNLHYMTICEYCTDRGDRYRW